MIDNDNDNTAFNQYTKSRRVVDYGNNEKVNLPQ